MSPTTAISRNDEKQKTMASKLVSRTKKAKLEFPVGQIARHLKAGEFADRVSADAPVYLAAVLEYLTAEVLELSGSLARIHKKKQIKPSDLQLVMREDKELSKLLGDVTIPNASIPPSIHEDLLPAKIEEKGAESNSGSQQN